jgi:hypothetical protein
LVFGVSIHSISQIIKDFKVDEKQGFNLVQLDFNVYKGITDIQRKMMDQPVHVHSELSKVNILPSFSYEIKDKVLHTHITHRNVESENLGKSLTHKLFSSSNDDFDHRWQVNLNSHFLYNLNFYFGIGAASLDLSHLPVSNCIIKSTSADIKLDYLKNFPNSVRMDTMRVTVNMGNVNASKLNLTNAKEMIFESNYGTINLSFSGNMTESCNVQATVGAGKVELLLPDESQPYIVKIKSTAMCRTYVPKNLREIGEKTYVSRSYHQNSKNLVTFTIDVSVGSVTLK